MAVGTVNNGSTPYIQEPTSDGGDVSQLQRQKEILQKQLEAVKSKPKNSQAQQDAAVRQIRQLERQIAEIEQKIEKQPQNQQQSQNAADTSSVNLKATLSQSHSVLAGAQNEQNALNDMKQDGTQENNGDSKTKAMGKLLDTYA